jgi:hypothetical protein
MFYKFQKPLNSIYDVLGIKISYFKCKYNTQ